MTQNEQFYLPEVDSAKFVSKRTELIRLQYDVTVRGVNCIAHQISLPPDADSAKFDEERKRLSRLRHPNILQHLGVQLDKVNLYVVTEALNTTLDEYLATVTDGPISVKVSILRDVSRGLQYLRSQTPPIVHRELIAQNVHLSFDMRAKIAVVGVSVPCDIKQIQSTDIAVYLPPEALTGTQQWSTVSFGLSDIAVSMPLEPLDDTKWDIYSFGVLLAYTALHKLPPYKSSLDKWMDEMGKIHPLYTLARKCVNDCPSERLPIEDLCQELDTLCESYPVKIIDILHLPQPVQRAESKHIHVQQQDQSSSSISGWFGAISSTISAVPGKVLNAVKKDAGNGTSVDKDNISQPTMVEEDEWMKIHVSSKVLPLQEELKLKDSQIAVYKEDFKTERNDRITCKATLDKCKKELHNKGEELARVEMLVRELQSRLAQCSTESQVKQLHDDYRAQLLCKERELANVKSEYQSVNGKLVSIEETMMHNKKLLTSELRKVQEELEAAKEEIAVKVAQVKQYQKQVEAYKQVQQMNKFEQLYNEEKQTSARLMEEMKQLKETHVQIADFENERKDRITCKTTLDKCKEELQNKEEELARVTKLLRSSEMIVRELESRQLAHCFADRQVKQPHDNYSAQPHCKEAELKNVKSECQSVNSKRVSIGQAVMHDKILQSSELCKVQAELEVAKEETAVKVAQVKQYQKQVEAYKQGTSDLKPLSQAHLESSASKDPIHSHISHGCDDSLPPPVMLPKARHLIGHPPQDSRPAPYPVEASQYQADGMVDVPF